MREYVPKISTHLHSFNSLQKERNHVKNKNIRLQLSAEYEGQIALLNDKIKESLQTYLMEIQVYNDKIDELKDLIKYLNQTNGSSQSGTFNQLIFHWIGVLDNFEHLIGFIKNDPEMVNKMRQVLFTFVQSMQNIQLIKLKELKNVEIQEIENNIVIENLQKQVSDLTAKNSELLNSVETLRKNLDEQQNNKLTDDKEKKLTNENNKIKKTIENS
uniref:BVpp95b protein n=1 Tax=Chelonus inanitus TaxID=49201 RepID=D7FB23_9HYME|nr:BVpp95b protein [Chelonus inanitus]